MVHVPHAFNILCIPRSISRVLVKVAWLCYLCFCPYLLRVSVMLDAADQTNMYHHGLGEQWIYLIMLTYTYICIYKLYLYRSIHIYCLGTKHTHLHVRQSEVMIPSVVGPPRSGMSERQAGWVQGVGARKRSLDGKSWFPPLWGVYYPCCKERGSPHGVIVE